MGRLIEAFKQFLDGSGDPLPYGYLEFLESGSNNTKKDTYFDVNLDTLNANPLSLDAEGRCPNVFGLGDYRIISYDGDPEDVDNPGQQIQMFDPVAVQNDITGGGGGSGGFGTWDPLTLYNLGAIIGYNTKYYRSLILDNLNNNPAIETASWEEIEFLPVWNENVTYAVNEVTHYLNNIYLSIQNANLNSQPDESPSYWRALGTGYYTSVTKTANYEILPTERDIIFVLGSGTTANRQFDLPAPDATYDGFRVGLYNASDYRLTIHPLLGGVSVWIDTSGNAVIEKGVFVELIYMHSITTWVPLNNAGPILGGQNLGTPTTPLEHIYQKEGYYHYFGDSQEVRVFFSGGAFYIENSGAASMYLINTANSNIYFYTDNIPRWAVRYNGNLTPYGPNAYDLGTSTYLIRRLYQGNDGRHYFGDSQEAYIVYYNNTTTLHVKNTIGNIQIGSEAYAHLYFVTDNTPRWYVISSGHLWPIEPGDYDIGGSSNEIRHLYQATNGRHVFGNEEDATIHHSGLDFYIKSATGHLFLYTDGYPRWYVYSTSGHFLPYAPDAYNIGSSSREIRNIYQGKEGYHFFGIDNDARINHDGSDFYLRNTTGRIYIHNVANSTIRFLTNDLNRWQIDADGNLRPDTYSNSYDLGSDARRIRNIYQGDPGVHFFGDNQEVWMFFYRAYINPPDSVDQFFFTLSLAADTGVQLFQDGDVTWEIAPDTGPFPTKGNIRPGATNAYSIGSTTHRVKTFYAINDLNWSSDYRLKENIEASALGLDFIKQLTPVSYTLKNLDNERTRYGLIAQEVRDVLTSFGMGYNDFCGVVYDKEEDEWSMGYTSFISPIIKAIQELEHKFEAHERGERLHND